MAIAIWNSPLPTQTSQISTFQPITKLLPTAMAPNSIVSRSSDETSFDEVQLSKNERIEAAYKEWTSGQTSKSQRQLAAEFGLSKSTLNDRINGASSKAQRDQSLQRVWVEEETAIAETLTRLQSWGWPARVQHARFMAEQILQARGDMKPLGKHYNHVTTSY